MNRRSFLQVTAAGASWLTQASSYAQAQARRINRQRISAISDEVAESPEEAIAFAHHFGLRWLELRDTPGLKGEKKPYFFMEPEEAKRHAEAFRAGGIKISFLNTNLLKKGLPGTKLASGKPLPEASGSEYDGHMDNLEKCIRAAHIFGCPYMRVFSFLRVEQPSSVEDRIANVLGEMGEKAQKEGLLLLLENEPSCNVGSSAELAAMLKKVPEKVLGCNWDGRNALTAHEIPYPDGYKMLPTGRIKNVQIKGKDMLDEAQPLDWAAIFAALDRDGYRGQIGLETHYFDGTNLERAHEAMAKIVKLADAERS